MRSFNISGPCDPARHFQLPPLVRSPIAIRLLREGSYLSISGPRQSGKTSLIKALADEVNAEGWARAVVLSCEAADRNAGVEEVDHAERLLIGHWERAVALQGEPLSADVIAQALAAPAGARLFAFLSAATVSSERPLVVILDEVDCLVRQPFVSALRQVRDGFQYRPRGFPHAMVLCGMRNLREHDRVLGGDGSGSPFNIVHELVVTSFTREEVVALYTQHTADTGQPFAEASVDLVWEQTRGQPWLVNALARTCVMDLVPDAATPVEAAHVEEAIRRLEASNPIHLTSLAARLAEPRVMRVVAPMVVGDAPDVPPDDLRYALELGLVVREAGDVLRPANPIYARALLKLATQQQRTALADSAPTWLAPDGRIDVVRLRENFLSFWKLQRGMMRDFIGYPEAVPHFGLMTYLDRVANGGGQVDREFAVGNGKLDLLLRYKDLRLPIEVKVHRDHRANPVPEGLAQLDRYCEGLRVDTGWLVVFDQRTGASGTQLDCEEVVTEAGRRVTLIRA